MLWQSRPDDLADDPSSPPTQNDLQRKAPRPLRVLPLSIQELEDRLVPTLIGQQLFPSDNPWNQNIASAPVAANSAAIISHIGSSISLHPDFGADNSANTNDPLYGIPVNIVHGNSTAKINVIIDNYPGESDLIPTPIPANAVIEGDYQSGPNPNGGGYNSGQRGDSHLIIWDEDTNTAYEFYGVTRPSDPTLFPNTSGVELPHTDGLWHAAQETVWNMNTNTFRTLGNTSADAAGLSILAGLARPDEGLPIADGGQGAINHALRVTLPAADVNPQYVYPASHIVNESQAADNLPFGGRLRLSDTPAVNALINQMPPESQILAHAMQQYGLILADIGSAMYVSGTSATVDTVDSPNLDLTWNLNDIFASNGLEVLTTADFQVVNLTPVVTGLSQTSAPAGSTITVTGQNFSGAAGHLSVFFGTTPSTSVTFLSDSQITVLVPSGTGSANVTVQSGVSDNGAGSDNVNSPIFGYGTSAVTSADQFTYTASAPPTSPTSSTITLASATDTSSTTDLITIVAVDTSSQPIPNLASNAFSFSLTGGTSSGTFSPVTQTSTPGTYTSLFTGTTAGTTSTITLAINSVSLSTHPSIQVTPGSISASTSIATFASPTVASGTSDNLTLVIKDAAGNTVIGLTANLFSLSLSNGSSSGTFSSVTPSAPPGTYTALFTGATAGSLSTATIKVNGVTLNAKPTIQVTPGAVSPTNSLASFAASSVASGNTDLLTLQIKDAAGNPISGLSANAFSLALGGGSSTGTFGGISATGTPGTYTVSLTAITAGTPTTLTATVASVTLAANPTLFVVPGPVSAARSTITLQLPTVAVGSTDVITITARDKNGNPIPGLASSAFAFVLTSTKHAGTLGAISATSTPGVYTVLFTGKTSGATATITAKVESITLAPKLTIHVVSAKVSKARSTIRLTTPTVFVGGTTTITITVNNSSGNPITALPISAFSLSRSAGGAVLALLSIAPTESPGTYEVLLLGTEPSTASKLAIKVRGVKLTNKSPIQVLPV